MNNKVTKQLRGPGTPAGAGMTGEERMPNWERKTEINLSELHQIALNCTQLHQIALIFLKLLANTRDQHREKLMGSGWSRALFFDN